MRVLRTTFALPRNRARVWDTLQGPVPVLVPLCAILYHVAWAFDKAPCTTHNQALAAAALVGCAAWLASTSSSVEKLWARIATVNTTGEYYSSSSSSTDGLRCMVGFT
jgi:hypothetical protein